MNTEEIIEILKFSNEIDVSKLSFMEQLYYMQTMCKFAEKLKPLAVKYAMKEHTKSTFLMRLGDDD